MVWAEQSTTLSIRITRWSCPDSGRSTYLDKERVRATPRLHRTPVPGERSGDYITADGAGKRGVPSLVGTARQAWLKLTTNMAFGTITAGLETSFPG